MAPFTVLTGRRLNSATVRGLLLTLIWYSLSPNFAVPAGRIRFCWFNAVEISVAERPRAVIRSGLRSTITSRYLPP